MITWSHDVSAQPRSGAAMVVDVRATPVTNAASEAIDEHHAVGHLREVVGPGHVITATELLAPLPCSRPPGGGSWLLGPA